MFDRIRFRCMATLDHRIIFYLISRMVWAIPLGHYGSHGIRGCIICTEPWCARGSTRVGHWCSITWSVGPISIASGSCHCIIRNDEGIIADLSINGESIHAGVDFLDRLSHLIILARHFRRVILPFLPVGALFHCIVIRPFIAGEKNSCGKCQCCVFHGFNRLVDTNGQPSFLPMQS